MAKFYLTNKAVEDLTEIWNYTCNEWSENQADIYYQMLFENFERIAFNPDQGKNYDGITMDLLGKRTGRHIIFYRNIQKNEIEIIRILHGRMDLKNKISE